MICFHWKRLQPSVNSWPKQGPRSGKIHGHLHASRKGCPFQGSHACPSRYHGGQSHPLQGRGRQMGDRGLKHPPDPQLLNAVLKAKANTSRVSGSRTWSLIYRWKRRRTSKSLFKKNTSTFEGFITCFVSLLSHVPAHSVYLCPFGLGIWVPSMHSNTIRHVMWSGRHNLQRNCHPLPALPWCWKNLKTIIFKEVLGVEKSLKHLVFYSKHHLTRISGQHPS